MKLKKIKKINIGGVDFNIKWDKREGGGSFDYSKKEIVIGTLLGDNHSFQILIHELKEIIQCEQSVRYDRIDESPAYEFHYNHAQHTDLCSRLAEYLIKFIV